MKIFAASAVIFATFLSLPLHACEPYSDEVEAQEIRNRQHEEQYVVKLATEVDEIVIGVVAEVDDVKTGPYVQRAKIQVTRWLKGKPQSTTSALMYRREEVKASEEPEEITRIPVCGERDPVQHNPYVLKTYRYLFYIKNGILIRANGFPVGPNPLSPDEETWLIQRPVIANSGK